MTEPTLPTILGIKSSAWAPAVLGALIYSVRKGESKWHWRMTSAVTGTFTAVYLGEAVVLHLGIHSVEFYNATIFLMGLLGVSLTEALIGIASDPKMVMQILRSRLPK